MTAIDPHAHIMYENFMDNIRAGRFGSKISIQKEGKTDVIVAQSRVSDRERTTVQGIPESTYRMDLRLKEMDTNGVERQIISLSPGCMYYGVEKEMNREISAFFNESMARTAKEMPDRFSCMATVPLQDPETSAKELERAVGLGHIGVQIGSNVAGRNLDDPSLDVFWAKVVALDVPVFIHPVDTIGIQDRLKDYYLKNFIGNPLDTTVAAASLMFGGVMDRFPKLKILLSHMGGFVPWIRGRWQHGYGERQEPKMHGAKDPDQYFGLFYYDTIIHNADCFRMAVETLGPDRILYGTDYPFDMGFHGPAREVPGLSKLNRADQEKILSSNAKALYKIR